MKGLKWIAMFGLMALLLTAVADDALAQRRGGGPSQKQQPAGFTPFLEFSATYGSMWGGNIDLTYGINSRKIRTGTGPSYAFALAYNLHPMQAVEFSYTRQEGSLDLDYKGLRTLTDMSVNFWHLGSIRYLTPPGKVRPFVMLGLGATYFSPEESTFLLDEGDPDTLIHTQSSTKFSFNLGLGVKSYFGKAEKIGIRASFKVMPTFYNTWGGMYFGSGGAGLTFSGNAIWQWEAAAGLTVKFGG
ncbi:MAG: outer membrane beta-barrel protein [Candidatus Krumholzibacteria bacterium]|nr:outer membrane beta-barrel protein [Candidatus Krumholzibacteria bacterium]